MRSYAKLIVAIIVLSACGTGSGSGDVAPASRQLTLQVSGHGSLTLSSGQGCRDRCVLAIASGTHVSVLATADTDSTFAGWSGACSGTGGCDIVVDRDLEIDGAFGLRPSASGEHVLTAATNGSGTVRSSPDGIDCGSACSAQFADRTDVTLSPIPDAGWRFVGWGGGCSGPGGCTVRISSDVTVWATFAKVGPSQHRLQVALSGNGSGRVVSNPAGIECGLSCSASFDDGTIVKLSAQAASASTFSGWGGACSGTADCALTVNGDVSVTAAFSAGTPPPNECAGLVPPPAGLPQGRHTIQTHGDCQVGVGDGSGTLALRVLEVYPSTSSAALDFVNPAGDVLASYPGTNAVLTGQLSGFEGMVWANNAWSTLRTWDQAGRATADKAMAKPGSADFIAEDPTGGVVVWHMEAPETGSHVLESYDEHLNLRWRVLTPGSGDPGALAVDRAGRTLVLYGADFRTAPKAVDGIWVDRDGTATTFRALGPQKDWTHLMGFALTQRVGSGLFLQSGDDWVGQLDSLSTSVAAPPDWLRSRPGTRLHMVHGGTGYAVLSPFTSKGCVRTIEVVSPSGTSCGATTFAGSSDSCSGTNPTVGYDGTVILEFGEHADQCRPGGVCTCTWQWWPGFFR